MTTPFSEQPPPADRQVVLITGASSGFGALAARLLAHAGHTVYSTMRDIRGKNAERAAQVTQYATEHDIDLKPVELDVLSQDSADRAIGTVIAESGRLDTVVHNAGHMTLGATESFTPEEMTAVFDTNVLGTQRVNKAALPHMRKTGRGLLVWVSSSTAWGGFPPFLGPYAAAKAAMDSLAMTVALEVARFGIESATIVPGSFTRGTEHFEHAGGPADTALENEYDTRYQGLTEQVNERLSALMPAEGDVSQVADAIARVVGMEYGTRPFRTVVDPADDGAGRVLEIAERERTNFMDRIGIADLLHPSTPVSH
ncbi:SDR family oxidoreductase [Streptomyces sp. TS71-3]|uniref:SDR family oxidoreductase n=1 Tax=Streptomyces sp. TS71-3 TaxID=2733862 RepID=UPI001B0D3B68|nr:SDR family oxidoreductase [Streptomyces sp. TS71-3]GHJ35656.1 short-chain dehydrogenase/reductase [Streptomyces sp. TS71-3]